MCRRVLLVVLWLLIGTRSRILIVGLLSVAEPLCPSRCLFGTILVTLCLMVWDWRASRAELMLSCWHDLLFLFCLLPFYLFLPLMGSLCGVGVFGLIECFHSLPALHSKLQFNNNNNNNLNFLIIFKSCLIRRRLQLQLSWISVKRLTVWIIIFYYLNLNDMASMKLHCNGSIATCQTVNILSLGTTLTHLH